MSSANGLSVSPREAAQWLSSGEAILIDVREPEEFKAEHIACAASVPLASVGGLFRQMQIPPGRKIIFQCVKGVRGEQACRIASDAAAGHPVYNLAGGIDAWKQAGLPVSGVQAAAGAGVSIFRQVQIGAGLLVFLSVMAGFNGYRAGFALAGFIGFMLVIAGVTGWCGMGLVLARMPWNRAA
jgi:rhodanese-related sulfurtransferase